MPGQYNANNFANSILNVLPYPYGLTLLILLIASQSDLAKIRIVQ
jgi:hypothetical protein